MKRRATTASAWLGAMLWTAGGLIAAFFANDYQMLVLGTVAASAMVGIGLNVLMGLSGQTSLGHAAFYAIGAYASAIPVIRFGWSWTAATLLAMFISGVAGALLSLPALRVRGPYLAMVTIAFGYFVEQGIADWKDLTGGWNGLMGIPHPSFFGTELATRELLILTVIVSGALVPLYAWFSLSRWGIIMRATRDAEVAASAMGANLTLVRVIAFVVSAAIAGVAGSFFAAFNGFISPESFPFFQSITFLLIVIVGGIGLPTAPLLGALTVVLLPEALSALAGYRLLFFGGLLLLVLLLAPSGIGGLLIRLDKYLRKGGVTKPWANQARHPQEALAPDREAALGWIAQSAGVVLRVEGLSIQFGGNHALSEVNLTVEPNKVTSLIGPNGAGKTTLINLVCGFYSPSAGRILLGAMNDPLARDLAHRPAHEIGVAGIARTFQTSQLFNNMSVLENVAFGLTRGRWLARQGMTKAEREALCRGLLELVGYKGELHQQAGALAHVDRRVVEIARAIAAQPRFLLLDEPAAGLSGEETAALGVLLRQLAEKGIGVLIVEHDMSLVMSVSDRIHVLDAGRHIASGTSAEIQANPQVKHAYLGEGANFGTDKSGIGAPLAARATPSRAPDSIIVTDLSTGYGAAPVLNAVSLAVREGETLAMLGANGAGKSTLMRAIAGLQRPINGAISFNGKDISNLSASDIARLRLILVPEGRQVFPELSVEDNIRLGAYGAGGLSAELLESLYALFPKLATMKDRRAGLLSGGEQQMLAIARGLAAKPQAMLFDEPSLGLAPVVVSELFATLAQMREQGMTILLVDQMAGLALSLADRADLLVAGSVVFSGAPQDLAASGLISKAYLS